MADSVKVIKRDGSTEPFEKYKIERVAGVAGLSPAQAYQVAQIVTDWIDSTGKTEIGSLEIRDRVLEELKKVNAYAANLFEWYQKSKGE